MKPLVVVLAASARAEAEEWVSLNRAWIEGSLIRGVFLAKDGDQREAATLQELPSSQDSDDESWCSDRSVVVDRFLRSAADSELLIARPGWAAHAEWRYVVERASRELLVASATGRLLMLRHGAVATSDFVDATPRMIASRIVRFSVGPGMHGSAARALPHEFLWFSDAVASRVSALVSVHGDAQEAVKAYYYEDSLADGPSLHAYLPDMLVMDYFARTGLTGWE